MAILHILSSFFFEDLTNTRVLRIFHESTAKEIHFCISTPGQYCVISFPFMAVVNETIPNLSKFGSQNISVHVE